MRIAIGSDEATNLTDSVVKHLEDLGHEVEPHGALAPGADTNWPDVAQQVGLHVARGKCDQGILLCWTGTGVSIAANKIPGVRAALCTDAEAPRGAWAWNNANILCMSLRLTSEEVAKEMLDSWFISSVDASESVNIEKLKDMDRIALNV